MARTCVFIYVSVTFYDSSDALFSCTCICTIISTFENVLGHGRPQKFVQWHTKQSVPKSGLHFGGAKAQTTILQVFPTFHDNSMLLNAGPEGRANL